METNRRILIICVIICVTSTDYTFSQQTLQASDEHCKYKLWEMSKKYFESRLIALKPNFVHFTLNFSVHPNFTSENAFLPTKWVWTYTSPHAAYPYLYWNIDHGLLSFGLLDTKTCVVNFVNIDVPDSCGVYIGTNETNWKITECLKDILVNMTESSYHDYENSFFCYLEENAGIRETYRYTAALYFNFPISYLNYKCCELNYTYFSNQYKQTCPEQQRAKWMECTLGPYILGLVLFLYFPILLLEACAWCGKNEVIKSHDTELREGYETLVDEYNNNIVYLDGSPPITLLGLLNNWFFGLGRNYPVAASRLRRLFGILLTPIFIYLQIKMYSHEIGMSGIKVEQLIAHGTPMGFLSLLGRTEDRNKAFAPMFGGALCILLMYYIIGVVFLVLPRSLKQIVERGMPGKYLSSPLCLTIEEIIHLSMVKNVSPEPGYKNGAIVCRCSIYMMFSKRFWLRVFEIQRERLGSLSQSNYTLTVFIIISPLYIIICFLEILACVCFYSVPIFGLVKIMVTGAVRSILLFKLQNTCMSIIFRNPITILVGAMAVFVMFVFYSYAVCLIFIQSFSFISQIIIFCFVAVIVYPSVSFGYLFFFVLLLYYIVRLVSNFGGVYLDLLQVAVEKSRELYTQINHTIEYKGTLLTYNIANPGIHDIVINGNQLGIPHNVLQQVVGQSVKNRVAEYDNMFGIQKDLFYHLVRKHVPIHIQALKIIFHLSCVIFLIAMTLSITSKFATGATSEISDVMHVIFIVTVGALPHVVEVALMKSSEIVRREIEERKIEQSIIEYWIENSKKNER